MFQGDPEAVEVIEQRLVQALNRAPVRSWDTINALVNLLTLTLATIECPDCRKAIARQFQKCAPEMLETADAMAATAKEAGFTQGRHLH